jgi:hypothetical protein
VRADAGVIAGVFADDIVPPNLSHVAEHAARTAAFAASHPHHYTPILVLATLLPISSVLLIKQLWEGLLKEKVFGPEPREQEPNLAGAATRCSCPPRRPLAC